jgi:hypothetical protein
MHSICLSEAYKEREIRFLALWKMQDWRVKVYSIVHHSRGMPDESLQDAVKALALDRLSRLETSQHYGVAFVIIHMARETDIVLIDWWTWENVLQQALFIGPQSKPTELKEVTASGLLACVWELEVHNYERLAWIECVLDNAVGPDLDEYADRHLKGTVKRK